MSKNFRQIKLEEWGATVVKGQSLLFKELDPEDPEHCEARVTVIYVENSWALARIDEILVKGKECCLETGRQVFVEYENVWIEEK
jgi:hypothetical protein